MKFVLGILSILLSSNFLLSSCDVINPPEEIPSYIRIDTFKVNIQDIDQGSSHHSITDIWLSVGSQTVGVYEMPFTVPSLEKGLRTLTIRPGIKLNGIGASRIAYPFYQPYIIDIELLEGAIHLIEPVSTYKKECKFAWIEGFEDPGVTFTYPEYSDTTFVNQKTHVRDGRYGGAIYLDEDHQNFEARSAIDFILPQNATPVLLEMDYFNNVDFEIGMYLIEDGAEIWQGLVGLRPSEVWKRIYVDLGTTATYEHSTESFRMAIRCVYNEELGELAYVYLDNIKLIHY